MLVGRIVTDQQYRGCIKHITHRSCEIAFTRQGSGESRKVRRAVVVDVIGFANHARELLQQIILFVRGATGTDNPNRLAAVCISSFRETFADQFESFFPCGWRQPSIFADERLLQAIWAIRKIKCVTSLDAEEIPINAALIAIVAADDVHPVFRTPRPKCRLAAIAAVGASRADMVHLPRTSFVPVRAGSQCADRTDVYAHATLFALQVIPFIGSDDRTYAAILYTQSPHVHCLAADAHTAVTQN